MPWSSLVDVVSERRLYPLAEQAPAGMTAARRALNQLHQQLARDGYCESYVDQLDHDVLAVTRHHPRSRRSVIVVAYTAFSPPAPGARRRPPALRVPGRLLDVLLEAELRDAAPAPAPPAAAELLLAPVTHELWMQQHVPLANSAMVEGAAVEGDDTLVTFRELRPGSVLVLRVAPPAAAAAALRELAAPALLQPFRDALRPLSLVELNALLYRCEAEERAAGGGAYHVPGHGALVYAGLAGAGALLADAAARQDLAHPLAQHLRAGDWLAEHLAGRLAREPALRAAGGALGAALAPVARLPRYLVPCYFERVAGAAARLAARAALARMSRWVRGGCSLTRALALTSVQLVGAVPGADLPPASPALPPPRPPVPAPTLSAGLPHFAVGYMRCWGRDTFIALPGLLLLPGRHAEARWLLLGFAAAARHGLLPNLLNGGAGARYNCRDAAWWWLRALQLYCDHVPDGYQILNEPVSRLFPTDESPPAPPGAADQPLQDVAQEILNRHFQGVVFRERDAGRGIDAHMTERGFTVALGVHPETGFPFGGNDANAGTWMDKMGSSEAAGTRGRPATPRDGSAVELVALAHAAARWLQRAHAAGRYRHAGVARPPPAAAAWTWAQWAERIERHFERSFWVGAESGAGEARPDLVHRRLMYKDSVGASQPWADYQLRCNYVVAMAVSPALFHAAHARAALDTARRLLLGPLGLKTLDPDDWAYAGDYDNDNNSTDPKVRVTTTTITIKRIITIIKSFFSSKYNKETYVVYMTFT
ncbi:unnamed protein product [Plutella xylostella]|uniref:(diamondback moth) hypothetical protein n=1 Tax=Plutella xylostella TaxID=51655 RepID=A0A8S4FEU6_PLUXY|nr:unnamed protein product [Plutella xylostella]